MSLSAVTRGSNSSTTAVSSYKAGNYSTLLITRAHILPPCVGDPSVADPSGCLRHSRPASSLGNLENYLKHQEEPQRTTRIRFSIMEDVAPASSEHKPAVYNHVQYLHESYVEACSEVKTANISQGFSDISNEARRNILNLCGSGDQLEIAKAIPSLRNLQKLNKLDLSFRSIDAQLLVELVSCVICQASHSRFPLSLSSLCKLDELKMCSSLLTLDLTGASITSDGVRELMTVCPQLQQLSLEGLQIEGDIFGAADPKTQLRVLNLVNCAGLSDPRRISEILRTIPEVINLDLCNSDITGEGVLVVAKEVNPHLQVLGLSELGWRVDSDHLDALSNRCAEIKALNISGTRVAHNLNFSSFMGFTKLEELIANMSAGVMSQISGETLIGFKHLPSLKQLYISRRITMDEIQRMQPIDFNFTIARFYQRDSAVSAGRVCRESVREANFDFPEHQLTHRNKYHGGVEPL